MNFVSLPHPNKLLVIESLDYQNGYDFHKPHRHDYFEIILIKEEGGHQFIDFERHELNAGDIFTVYPGQVHLLERKTAQGLLIQFHKNIFDFILPFKHHHLYFEKSKVELTTVTFLHLYNLTENIFEIYKDENSSRLAIHKAYNYLQIILISLIEQSNYKYRTDEDHFSGQFLSLLGQNIKGKRKVTDYAEMMSCSVSKLNNLCKKSFGKPPLKLIHEELMLEIRRLILLDKLSLKEIAYELNFDSNTNFSTFVKTNTNKTPSEMQLEITGIYR